jgi:COP9 signalosome complex subunit 6
MQVDGQELTDIKFSHLPYTIDTDETEMIAIDYVAKGAGSAAAVGESQAQSTESSTKPAEPTSTDMRGKRRADLLEPTDKHEANDLDDTFSALTPEEDDQVANMTTRLNSVKMLQSRISLLRGFIQTLPPSYITDQDSVAITPTSPDPADLPHLRNIQALITRLSLLTPVDSASSSQPLAAASQFQSNDVALVNMLSLLGQDIQALSELGRKFATVENTRSLAKSKHAGAGPKGGGVGGGAYEGLVEGDGRFGGLSMSNVGGMMV